MMTSDWDLFDSITNAALEGCGGDVRAHKQALWDAACAILADVLRETDQLGRERLLRGLEDKLRESAGHLDALLKPSSPYPRIH